MVAHVAVLREDRISICPKARVAGGKPGWSSERTVVRTGDDMDSKLSVCRTCIAVGHLPKAALADSGQRLYMPEPLVGIGLECVSGCFTETGNESEMDRVRYSRLGTDGPRVCPSGASAGKTARDRSGSSIARCIAIAAIFVGGSSDGNFRRSADAQIRR
jgi:hypothetical protein